MRYDRQMILPEIGEEGQLKLKKAKVLIVGVGGLGSPIALYLAGAGVGCIGLVDDDRVSISNLQRQVLYSENELDKPKAVCAAERLSALNSGISILPYSTRLTEENAGNIIRKYDIVVDGCDNFATRYLINDICIEQRKPYVYGAICGFEGQVSVFNYGEMKKSYRDLYPNEEEMKRMPPPPKGQVRRRAQQWCNGYDTSVWYNGRAVRYIFGRMPTVWYSIQPEPDRRKKDRWSFELSI